MMQPFRLPVSTNTRGSLFILCSAATFPVMGALVKFLSNDFHPLELAFFRCLFGGVVLIPFFVRRPTAIMTSRRGIHLFRGILGVISMWTGFTALALLPLAEAVTLGFTRVLFLIPLAVLILGDRVDLPRWIATIVGFGGIVLMVNPSTTDLPAAGVALSLGSALIIAGVKLTVKALTETEGTLTIQLWFAGFSTLATFVPALYVWRWPEPHEFLLLLAIGAAGTLGQVFTVLGLRGVQASVVMPVDYTRLIFATFYGFLLFGHLPGAATIAGAGVIVVATLYIAQRGERVETTRLGLIKRR